MTADSTQWLKTLVDKTHDLRADVLLQMTSGPQAALWHSLHKAFDRQTGIQEPELFADAIAQAIVCGLFALRSGPDYSTHPGFSHCLLQQADPLVTQVLSICFARDSEIAGIDRPWPALRSVVDCLSETFACGLSGSLLPEHAENEQAVYFYERFLQAYDGRTRRLRGVWYTPACVARFMIRSVDEIVRAEFLLPDGLVESGAWAESIQTGELPVPNRPARTAPPSIHILDPAMGTGAFLLAVVDLAFARVRHSLDRAGVSESQRADAWDTFVERHLLPRLHGIELMLPAVVLAHILLAQRLLATGYRFRTPVQQRLVLADTLLRPPSLHDHCDQQRRCLPIVVGNPPFSGISANRQPWIQRLLRGGAPGNAADVANYFTIAGKPIRERKHWLEDDYVKFIRLAHWMIESAGAGIVCLVTNHGFLDNSTFRAMRWQLLNTFPCMTLVDLHGNRRGGETGPDGLTDENIFSIEQGIVISLMRKPLQPVSRRTVDYLELWGPRADKHKQLNGMTASQSVSQPLSPNAPNYFLVPRDTSRDSRYEQGFRLPDIMPVFSTAAVTARDPLVIGFRREDLLERLERFRNLRIPDTQIRRQFFSKRRSASYPRGDTRGWDLSAARKRLAGEPNWQQLVRTCYYRPFDQRWVFWADWMIDWPRLDVMRHLEVPGNLALIARRQTPPSQPCTYFWVTDTIVLDGMIRSDNRGSESVFPLYLNRTRKTPTDQLRSAPAADETRTANFSPEFIDQCVKQTGLRWRVSDTGPTDGTLGPAELLHFIYALFHAPSYRAHFADNLRIDFPRVFIPHSATLMKQLCKQGEALVSTHLLQTAAQLNKPLAIDGDSTTLERGYPKHEGENLWINGSTRFSSVSDNVWNFRVGTHQICRKWLRDRLGQELTRSEIHRFSTTLKAIEATASIMRRIDQHVTDAGGWESAFA